MANYNESKIYDERLYLPRTADLLITSELESTIRKYNNNVARNKRIYHDKIDEYKKFILLVAKLIKELGLENNSLSMSIVIGRLLQSGYFSRKGSFKYTQPKGELDGFYGINVVLGRGCCRNIAPFCKDVFDELGMYSHALACVSGNDLTMQEAYSSNANHMVNIIEFDGKYYAYDAGNDVLFDFKSGMRLESKFTRLSEVLVYKPSMDMIFNNFIKEDVLEYIKKYKEASKGFSLSYLDYMDIMHETSKNVKANSRTLCDFKRESREYIKRITQKN